MERRTTSWHSSNLNMDMPLVAYGHAGQPLLMRFNRYLVDEVLPLIRSECGDQARPITTGASLGAFLTANAYFKHPDLFGGVIAMSGSYDVRSYLKAFPDDNVYFNNPVDYLPNLNDDYYL